MISANLQRTKYVVGDLISSIMAWFAYTCVRYNFSFELIQSQGFGSFEMYLKAPMVKLGFVIFPLVMMLVYYLSGYYNEVFKKSRLQELFVTLASAAVNTVVIFFVALINDMANDRAYNYDLILLLFSILFVMVYSVRAIITADCSNKIKNRKWQFNTLIIGCGREAKELGENLNTMPESIGYNVVGYVRIPGEEECNGLQSDVYDIDDLDSACRRNAIKEFIVAPTDCEVSTILDAINRLFVFNLPINMKPTLGDVILNKAKIQRIIGDPMVDISRCAMGECSKNIKRLFDVLVASVAMIILSPIFIILAILIKIDSKGPVFYKQQRVGLHKKLFTIYKFRSMVLNAEQGLPQLSSDNDERITKIGKWLRKYRLDEIPQFYNILKGDMSLVGPRPEREYFVKKILEKVPYYTMIYQIRPGVTSLGMVKYGYAKNVGEMIERLRYDLLYLENMSLTNDLKILIYTVKVVLSGRGI